MKRLSLYSFPSTSSSVKGIIDSIANTHERAVKRASVVLGIDSKKHSQVQPAMTSLSLDTFPGFETSPLEFDLDTPLSWRCQEFEPDFSESGAQKAAPLMDSQVFVFWREDFDFACAGESCYGHGRPARRQNLPASGHNTRTSRSLRRWSSPHSFGLFSSSSSAKQSQGPHTAWAELSEHVRPNSVNTPTKRKPSPLRVDSPFRLVKAHGVSTYCASNRWGNQPPAGYI